MGSHLLELTGCVVDLTCRVVRRGGLDTPLTQRETALLSYLTARLGVAVPRAQLLVQVWGYSVRAHSRAVDATVARLRAKIEQDSRNPEHLLTVAGVGYRLVAGTSSRSLSGTNLGVVPARLVGREEEAAALRRALAESRLCTVVGAPGVGKSALAVAVARELLNHRPPPGGVWRCACRAAASRSTFFDAVAAGLGCALPPGGPVDDRLGHAIAALGACIVVFDDADRVVPLMEVLSRWLDRAPAARFIVTSRQRLGQPGERVVQVDPLRIEASRELLTELAADVGCRLAPAEEGHIDALLAELDGLPLELQLVASRLTALEPASLRSRLEVSLQVDPAGPCSRSHRDRLDEAWDVLSEVERSVWVQCSVFRGSFSVRDAEEVVVAERAVLDVLHALVDKSLVAATQRSPRRLRLLGLTRAYLRDERARPAEAMDALRLRHARWIQRRQGGHPCMADHRAAVCWAHGSGRHRLARDLMARMAVVEGVRGPETSVMQVVERLLADAPSPLVRVELLTVSAAEHLVANQHRAAAVRAREAIERGSDDPVQIARAWAVLGRALGALGQFEQAIEALQQAQEWLHGTERAWVMVRLSIVTSLGGRHAAARRQLLDALAELRGLDDPPLEAYVLGQLMSLAHQRGDLRSAVEHGERGVAKAAGAPRIEAAVVGYLACVYEHQGRTSEARRALSRWCQLARDLQDPRGQARALVAMAHLEQWAGCLTSAQELLQRAQPLVRALGHDGVEGLYAMICGRVAQRLGEHGRALACLDAACDLMDRVKIVASSAIARSWRAESHAASGDRTAALADAAAGATELKQLGNEVEAGLALCRWGRMLAAMDREEEARQRLRDATELVARVEVLPSSELARERLALHDALAHPRVC
ncbi:MAG: winged helix-turn-helix domain-containing protein [Myxococcales bacterium]|nr:winged helix-turn-helix domain-containing protein [Myxococcales bacterium]